MRVLEGKPKPFYVFFYPFSLHLLGTSLFKLQHFAGLMSLKTMDSSHPLHSLKKMFGAMDASFAFLETKGNRFDFSSC